MTATIPTTHDVPGIKSVLSAYNVALMAFAQMCVCMRYGNERLWEFPNNQNRESVGIELMKRGRWIRLHCIQIHQRKTWNHSTSNTHTYTCTYTDAHTCGSTIWLSCSSFAPYLFSSSFSSGSFSIALRHSIHLSFRMCFQYGCRSIVIATIIIIQYGLIYGGF